MSKRRFITDIVPHDYEDHFGWYVYAYQKSCCVKIPVDPKPYEPKINYCEKCDRLHEHDIYNSSKLMHYTREDMPFLDFLKNKKVCKACN